MQMLPKTGGVHSHIYKEWPELGVTRADLIKTHLIDDVFQCIDLMRHERDAPFPVVQPNRAGNELADATGILSPNARVAAHQLLARREIEHVPVIATLPALVH